MKNRVLIITIFLFTCIVSCERAVPYMVTEQNGPQYCIYYTKDGNKMTLLSEEELNVAKSLFEANHLDYSQLQFYGLQSDENGYHHVRCYQYVNGLKVFSSEVIYHFKPTGILYFTSGELINHINQDTLSTMPSDSVIEIFLHKVEKDPWNSGRAQELKQGCYDLEFGYYNLNGATGFEHLNYTKAWKVNFKGNSYPYIYIDDQRSKVIYYDNGVRE